MANCDNCVGCADDAEIHRLCDDCMQEQICEDEERHAAKDAEIAQLRADLARVTAERDARLDMSPAMLGAVLEAYENGEDEVEHSDGCAVCAALSVVREFVARGANGGV